MHAGQFGPKIVVLAPADMARLPLTENILVINNLVYCFTRKIVYFYQYILLLFLRFLCRETDKQMDRKK
jgi:hypothetical protein